MKTRVTGILLACCMLFSISALADESLGGLSTALIVGGTVTVYDGIWNNSNVVGTLVQGTGVVVLQTYGNWVQVHARAERIVGWVQSGQIQYVRGTTVYPGIVISQNVSLREERSTGARRITSIPNGTMLDIVNEVDGWYYVNYYNDAASLTPLQGWCVSDYIVRDPSYVTTTKATYVYSMPSLSSKKVGQVVSGTQLVVIGEYDSFWVVNLRSASGFIHKNDIESGLISGGNG